MAAVPHPEHSVRATLRRQIPVKDIVRSRYLLSALLCAALLAAASSRAHAQASPPDSLAARIEKIMSRPEFARANFGIEFCSLDTGAVIYALNERKMFVPASTTKTLTEGALLAALGADYRFHTRIYRTGPVDSKGRLKGDLVDASLFPDGPREGGTDVVMSSIMVNDNVIDLLAKPGAKAGDPLSLEFSPHTSYIRFVNHLITSPAGSKVEWSSPEVATNPDGSVSVTLTGSLPLGAPLTPAPFAVPSPTKFAETLLREALVAAGVQVKGAANASAPDFSAYKRFYMDENLVAEHISPPLSEEIKVTLKVSQNLHAGMVP